MIIKKVAWICLKEQKVLMARSKGKDLFYVPGGKIESGETNLDALKREVKEELSVDLIENTIKFFQDFEAPAHSKPEGTIVKIGSYFGEYKGTLKEAAEVEELAWIASNEKEKTSLIDHKILDALKAQGKIL